MSITNSPTLNCRGCGVTIRMLTVAEMRYLAANPLYEYAAACDLCADEPKDAK